MKILRSCGFNSTKFPLYSGGERESKIRYLILGVVHLSHIHFSEITVIIGHSSSMCLTDKIFLQTHVTFCEYLVFHKFKRNLHITLAKYLEQERIANLLFFQFVYIQSS